MTRPPLAQVIAAHRDEIMAIPGVVGMYEGLTPDGRPVLRVMVVERRPEIERRVPRTLDGYPVEIEVTGEIRAFPDSQ